MKLVFGVGIILCSLELTNDIRVKKSLTQKAEELSNEI